MKRMLDAEGEVPRCREARERLTKRYPSTYHWLLRSYFLAVNDSCISSISSVKLTGFVNAPSNG